MDPNKKRTDDALLRIFVDLGADDGSPLLLDDLRLEWSKLQLRHPDLIDGVRRLVFAGWLHLTHTDAGPALGLSLRGRHHAKDSHADIRSLWDLVAAVFTALNPAHRPLRGAQIAGG